MNELEALKSQIVTKLEKRPHVYGQTWQNYDAAMNTLNDLVWMDIQPEVGPELAFTTRSGGFDGVYEIFVHKDIEASTRDGLKLHEAGHILFNHMSMQEAQREIIVNKILTYWPKLAKHVDLSSAVANSKEDEAKVAKNYAKKLCESMLNIAMDMEVNSKCFDAAEWAVMKDNTDLAFMLLKVQYAQWVEDLDPIVEFLKENENNLDARFTKPIWPEDYKYPLGLTYGQYIDLMLSNPDEFMQKLIEQLGKDGDDEDGDQQSGNGNGNGKKGKKLSAEDIDNLKNQVADADSKGNGEKVKKAEKEGKSASSERNGQDGYSPIGEAEDNTVYIEGSDSKDVENFITKQIFNQIALNTKTDPLYNTNRAKLGGDNKLMVSRVTKMNNWRPGNIYMIVDCSGSIDKVAIEDFINVTAKVAKTCGAKSRLIWWDTKLEGDTLLKEKDGPKGCGGTDIASGIDYVYENYLKDGNKNDKVFIVSDYEDSLYHWAKVLDKVRNDCFGICWTHHPVQSEEEELRRVGYCSTEENETVAFLQKKLKTAFVNVSIRHD